MIRWMTKNSMTIRGAKNDVLAIYRNHLSGQKSSIRKYLAEASVPALKIGSGTAHNSDWLETDIRPSKGLVFLDATKAFPMPNASFGYVYAEHMIEHINLTDCRSMLRECRRVLKSAGVIRIATPDLSFLVGLYDNPTQLGEEYIEWIGSNFIEPNSPKTAAYVINTAMHSFGHQFIYDERTLTTELLLAGFANVRRVPYGKSQHPTLNNVETHHAMTGGTAANLRMVQAETMILEAVV